MKTHDQKTKDHIKAIALAFAEETSEQRHGISAQPADTCPLIDKARACVEKCQREMRNYERAEEAELRDMLSTVESELANLIGWRSGLLEEIRVRASEIRHWGQEWKDAAKDYWSKITGIPCPSCKEGK